MNENTAVLHSGLAELDDGSDFAPIAYYDKHMDCIRVQLRDCSFVENRANQYFTVLKSNGESDDGKIVGLNIKGMKQLFATLSLPESGVLKLTDLIDKMVAKYPESTFINVKDQLRGVMPPDMKVSLDDALAA